MKTYSPQGETFRFRSSSLHPEKFSDLFPRAFSPRNIQINKNKQVMPSRSDDYCFLPVTGMRATFASAHCCALDVEGALPDICGAVHHPEETRPSLTNILKCCFTIGLFLCTFRACMRLLLLEWRISSSPQCLWSICIQIPLNVPQRAKNVQSEHSYMSPNT